MNEFDVIEEYATPHTFEIPEIEEYTIFLKIKKEDDFFDKINETQIIYGYSQSVGLAGYSFPSMYWALNQIITMNKYFLGVHMLDDSDYYYLPYLFKDGIYGKDYFLKISISEKSSLQNISIVLTNRVYNHLISLENNNYHYINKMPEYIRVVNYCRKPETQFLEVLIDKISVNFEIMHQYILYENTFDVTYSLIKIHPTTKGFIYIKVLDSDNYISCPSVYTICDI